MVGTAANGHTAASGVYAIGSPMVDRAVIHLDPKYYAGGTFTVTAKDNSKENIYVESATLDRGTRGSHWYAGIIRLPFVPALRFGTRTTSWDLCEMPRR